MGTYVNLIGYLPLPIALPAERMYSGRLNSRRLPPHGWLVAASGVG